MVGDVPRQRSELCGCGQTSAVLPAHNIIKLSKFLLNICIHIFPSLFGAPRGDN